MFTSKFSVLVLFIINLVCIKSSLKFPIENRVDRCFIEDLFSDGLILVNYHIDGLDDESITAEERQKIISNFRILVFGGEKDYKYPLEILSLDANNRKGKIALSLNSKKFKQIRICVRYENGISYVVREITNLLFVFKFSHQFSELDIDSALKKDAVEDLEHKLKLLKIVFKPTQDLQESEMNDEEKTALDIINCSNLYYKLAILQIIFVVILAIVQLINFKKFLSYNKII